ncbi:MAG: Fic family protein [Candidatus Marinimicrobia bacterium]|nr:Fic family protein [Candidatus Neomarinimicrobiota bacterium]
MKSKYIDKLLLNNLTNKLEMLNDLRPLPKIAVEKIREQFKLEMTYNSNAIEGNCLTLKETGLVINEGFTVKGKPLKDHLEAKNQREALDYLYDLVSDQENHTISNRLIRSMHQIVVQDTDKEWAGRYRNSNVYIAGTEHVPPDALEVEHKMKELIKWLAKEHGHTHSIELAAIFHHSFVKIHPFFDRNGRTARLMMNVILMQSGYPLAIILKNDRKKYYRVLAKADKGELKDLVLFIATSVMRSLEIYLKALTPMTQKRESYVLLSEAAIGSGYSAKYLNLLISQGKLEGHKEGRNWYTTKESILRYKESRKRIRN